MNRTQTQSTKNIHIYHEYKARPQIASSEWVLNLAQIVENDIRVLVDEATASPNLLRH